MKEDLVQTPEREKAKFDKFRFIIFFAYAAVTAVTIVLSLWNVGFDFTKVIWEKLASDLLINYAITIALMYAAMKDGNIHFHTSESHPYMKNLEFMVNRAWKVIRTGLSFAFNEYSHKKYKDNLEDHFRFILQTIGIQDVSILRLSFADIKGLMDKPLVKVIDEKECVFDTLTPEQYVVVYDIKNGKYSYDEIPPDWFLNGFTSKASDLYSYYSKAAENRKKAKRARLFYRLAMLFLISLIWAALFIGDGAFDSQSIVDAVVRTGTAIMTIASGYMGAKEEVDGESDELVFKFTFIDGFFSDYNSGVFIPKNITELIKSKLDKLEKEAALEEIGDGNSK